MKSQDGQGPYGRLAAWVLKNKAGVMIGALLITLISGLAASRLDVEANLLALLPAHDKAAQGVRELQAKGGSNLVTLAFEAKEAEKLDPWLDALCTELEKGDEIVFAIHEVDRDLAFQLGLLQLAPADVQQLTKRLRGAVAFGGALNPIVTRSLLDMGPLTQRIEKARSIDLFHDGPNKARVLVRAKKPATDPKYARVVMNQVNAALAAAAPEQSGITVRWIGGAYRHNVEDADSVVQDVSKTSLASMVLVFVTVALAFRSIRATVLVYAPVVVAATANLAATWLLFGSINTFTSVGTALLFGLGTDYAVHLLGRYRELRAEGMGLEQAVIVAWDRVGQAVATAALTTAAGFLSLAAASFQGFAQLGVVLSIGILFSVGAVYVMVPALIVWLDKDPPKPLMSHLEERRSATAVAHEPHKAYRLAPLGLMVAVIATGLAASTLPDIGWEFDVSAMRKDGLAYEELSPDERALARESYTPVVVEYADEAALWADQTRLQKLIDEGHTQRVSRVVSIASALPPDLDARVEALRELKAVVQHPNFRYLPPPVVQALAPLKDWDGEPPTRDDLPLAVRTILGAADATTWRLLIFPKGNMWDLREAAAYSDEIDKLLPGRTYAGEYLAMGSLYRTVSRDMPKVAALAFLLVAALVTIDLRKPARVAVAVGTLLAGVGWCGAAMVIFGLKLSIMNIVGLPILLGIAIDVCVHLLHRVIEEGPGRIQRALETTGVASALTTLTTIESFGILVVASNRGVRSLGTLVAIGLTVEFFVAAALLPLAWAAGWRISSRGVRGRRWGIRRGGSHSIPPTHRDEGPGQAP